MSRIDSAFAADQTEPLRKAYVLANQPDQWPKGNWRPMNVRDFEALIQSLESNAQQPQPAVIDRAIYTAKFDPAAKTLVGGTLSARTKLRGREATLMKLEPLRLALSGLQWSNSRPATWGTTRSGATSVFIEDRAGELTGAWTLAGHGTSYHVEFPIEIPQAVVSQIRLSAPTNWNVASSRGFVRAVAAEEKDGWRDWIINLGSETASTIQLKRVSESARAAVLYSIDSTYSLRAADLVVQFEVTPQVFNAPVRELRFAVSKEVEIQSITSADTSFEWRPVEAPQQRRKQIAVTLPDTSSGMLSPILIQGVAAIAQKRGVALPTATMINAGFRTGSLALSIDEPLKLRSTRSRGLLQTETLFDGAGRQRVRFQQYLPNHYLTVDTGDPQPTLTTKALTGIVIGTGQWSLISDIQWNCTTGSSFSLAVRVPRSWRVTDLQLQSNNPAAELANWMVTDDSEGSVVTIELKEPVRSGSPKTLRFFAERTSNAVKPSLLVENIQPIDCNDVDLFLAISTVKDFQLSPTPESGLKPFSLEGISDEWGADVLEELLGEISDDRQLQLFRSTLVERANTLQIEAPQDTTAEPLAKETTQPSDPNDNSASESSALPDDAAPRLPAVRARLRSIFSASEESDIHHMRYEVQSSSTLQELEVIIPESIELLSIVVNGSDVQPGQGEADNATEVATSEGTIRVTAADGPIQSVDVKFRSTSQSGFFRRTSAVSLPQVSCPIVDATWEFATAPGTSARQVQGLRMQNVPTSMHWRERLFGPLARERDDRWFNPFRLTSWSQIFAETNRENFLLPQGDQEFAPTGWPVWFASNVDFPKSIKIQTWDDRVVSMFSWVLFAVALLLICLCRLLMTKVATRASLVTLFLSSVAAMLLPETLASIAGGIFSGALIAALLPKSFFEPRPVVPVSHSVFSNMPPTVSFERLADSAKLLLLVSTMAWALWMWDAQENLHAQEELSKTAYDVLIPVDDDLKPDASVPLVYVDQKVFDRWQENLRLNQPHNYVISSAEYEANIDENGRLQLQGKFQVDCFSQSSKVARVRFDIDSAHVGGADACLVNGEPTAILPSGDESAFIIELPLESEATENTAKQSFQVELNLHPSLEENENGKRWRLSSIPSIANSQLVFRCEKADAQVHSPTAIGQIEKQGQQLTAQIGTVSELVLECRPSGEQSAADVTVELAELVEISQPTLMNFRYQLGYVVDSGIVPAVRLKVGDDLIVDRIFTLEEELPFEESTNDGQRVLDIEFIGPRSENFEIFVDLMKPIPIKTIADAIATPAAADRSPAEFAESFPLQLTGTELVPEHKIQTAKIGLRTTSAFLISPRLTAGTNYSPVPTPRFLEAWPDSEIPRPEHAFDVDVDAVASPLDFELSPVLPTRLVRLDQTAQITAYRINWTCNIEILTTDAPAFFHQLLNDPRMTIESISVLETDAEQLAHHSQLGVRSNLFLRDSNIFLEEQGVGIQNVVVKGHVPLASGETALPIVGFHNAEIRSSSLRIYADRDVAVQTIGFEQLEALDEPIAANDSSNDAVLIGRYVVPEKFSKLPWFLDQVAIRRPEAVIADPELVRPSVKVKQRNKPANVKSLTVLDPLTDDAWQLSTEVVIRSAGQRTTPFSVYVAPALAQSVVPPEGNIFQAIDHEDGSATYRTSQFATLPKTLRFTASAMVRAPLTGTWALPSIRVIQANVDESVLAIMAESEYRPNRGRTISELDDWLKEHQLLLPSSARRQFFSSRRVPWNLQRQARQVKGSKATIPLLRHQISREISGQLDGRTSAFIENGTSPSCELHIPAGVELRSIFINGRPHVTANQIAGNDIEIPFQDEDVLYRVDLSWSRNDSTLHDIRFPSFRGLKPAESAVELILPNNSVIVRQSGWKPFSTLATQVDHAEQLVELIRVGVDGNLDVASAWSDLSRLMKSLERSVFRNDINETQEARIARLKEQFGELSETISADTSVDTTAGSIDFEKTPANAEVFQAITAPSSYPMVMSRDILALIVGIALSLCCLPIVLSSKLSAIWKLDQRPLAGLVLIGVIWWAFLTPGVIGVLLLIGILLASLKLRDQLARESK
ncbi:MAG: hypothetical protein CMJ78_16015 [Planctomycetaceae bacterium]|nr:hypothetical protein [Planctomycetaceae bacterium]